MNLATAKISGWGVAEQEQYEQLVAVLNSHASSNSLKERYYEGKIRLSEVNLGIALPTALSGLEIGCEWGGKCVDVLASRSRFDGFVGSNGGDVDLLSRIMEDNHMVAEYKKACRDELKFGCTFATLSADPDIGCRIRFHTPKTAAALWDGEKGRISCGLAIIDTATDNKDRHVPAVVHMYTDTAVWEIVRVENKWTAYEHPHSMGRPLMEPLVWNATSSKPFGRSRIKEPIRRLIQSYIRTLANATIGLEFDTTPQKYLLGVTDEQYDALMGNKFKQYVGNILAATANPETGQNPTFGQLQQGNIEPHVQMLRMIATQFSAATGLSVTDTGVINDANPASSDAILAQSQTLVALAEELNAVNGDSLKTIAMMAQAIAENKVLDDLDDSETNVVASFKNPAMPSVSATADAAIKIASVRPTFAQTDVFCEMIGFSQADIRRIRGQESRARGLQVLSDMSLQETTDADNAGGLE